MAVGIILPFVVSTRPLIGDRPDMLSGIDLKEHSINRSSIGHIMSKHRLIDWHDSCSSIGMACGLLRYGEDFHRYTNAH